MNLEEWRLSFISLGVVLALLISAPVITEIFTPKYEPFIAMAVLGENNLAEGYYPNNDPNIPLKQLVGWSLYLYNHMGESQYVVVKVKLLDETTPPPDSALVSPSPALTIYELRLILRNNETRITPFEWSVLEAKNTSDRLLISKMMVNGQKIDLNTSVSNREKTRIVFELWAYDYDLRSFRFDLDLNNERNCVWNQIWFMLKLTE